jgi:heme/copper-type cytochrome/quinol oxidase subunit 3
VTVQARPIVVRAKPTGRWGMFMFVATEATIFALLLFTYFFIRAGATDWPTGGLEKPELMKSGIRTAILLLSSVPVEVALRAARKAKTARLRLGLVLTLVMGGVFIAGHFQEYTELSFRPTTNVYGSLFYTITGFHAAHLIVGLAMVAAILTASLRGKVGPSRMLGLENVVLYWHFVDAVWVAVYSSLYLSVSL